MTANGTARPDRRGSGGVHRPVLLRPLCRFPRKLDRGGATVADWAALTKLHLALVRVSPTLGARVALAATIGETDGAAAGLASLDGIDGAERFQPAWATRAYLLRAAGHRDESRVAFDRAISLSSDAAVRRTLFLAMTP